MNQQPPVQDEVIQAVLRMNQKHILFPSPGIFQPLYLPQIFPLLPTSPFCPLLPTSPFCPLLSTSPLLPPSPHFLLTPSLELKRTPKVEWLRVSRRHETQGLRTPKVEWLRVSRRHETQGLRKVDNSTLKDHQVEKGRGTLHPKHRSNIQT